MRDALGRTQSLLVLGGGSEIGLAIARALVERRTRVVALAGRRPERLAGAAAELEADGAARVELVVFDADATATHEHVVDEAFARVGELDVAVLAFGVLPDQARAERDGALAVTASRTNFLGAVSVLTPLARRMRAQGHGTIVVLSSVAGERARRSNYVYGASKAGLDAFAQGLGDALAGSGVDVLVVRPGFVRTAMTRGMHPAPLATSAEAVAEATVAALERRRAVVWVPGSLRWVMALLRHLPRPLFRRLPL